MRYDIDQFRSSLIAAYKTIHMKERHLQKPQALLLIIHALCSPGIPLKFSHDDNHDDKI